MNGLIIYESVTSLRSWGAESSHAKKLKQLARIGGRESFPGSCC